MKQRGFLKRGVAVLTLSVTVSALFSGCFAKEAGPARQQAPESIQLVYYKLFDNEDVIRPLIEQYKAQHPNVQITYRKFEDPEEYLNLIVNELAEGEGPDIFSVPNYWMLRNVKKVSPMPADMMTPQQFQETFVSVAANDLILRDPTDGAVKIFGIPLNVDTLALYYNKSHYEDKIPSRGRPPATWEGLKEDVFQLTKKDNSFERFEVAGIAMGRSDNIARAVDILYLLMLQYDAGFYNDNISKAEFSKQRSLTATGIALNPAAEALKLYASFALPANKNYSWNSYLADSKSAEKEMDTFARGKVSMIFGYSYLYEQITSKIKDLESKGVKTISVGDIRIAPAPQVIDPATSTEKRDAYANYFVETVGRNTAHPREAWDFLTFISSKDNLEFYNQKTHRPTSRRDMIDDQKQDPIYGVYADQIGYAESIPIYDDVRYSEIFSRAIDSVLATVSAVDALRTAEDQINLLLPADGLIPPAPKADATRTTQQTTQ
ncbi:MAG TPA: extracellular solute-binding protein [Candidatus Gracilibacteria bacterium]|nr:extracellular solute-binding protein [Candidatus Gracilibacteria bacterium]